MAENRESDLARRTAALREEVAGATERLVELTGRIAETEEDVAAARERMAETAAPPDAEHHRRRAREAREFAAHERDEQRRLRDRPEPPDPTPA
jgi:predicted  nucleic acid-binding Zn-ribbon protein